MIDLLENQFKQVLLNKWKAEVMMNQRVLFGLANEFVKIAYFDEELWTKIAETTVQKKKINNTHDFKLIHNCLTFVNEQTELKGKFSDHIDKLFEKHYTDDREWRYSRESMDFRPLTELIEMRDRTGPRD